MTMKIETSPTFAQAKILEADMETAGTRAFTAALTEQGAVAVLPGIGIGTWHEFEDPPTLQQLFGKLAEVIEIERAVANDF